MDNSECFGVKLVKIYPKNMVLVDKKDFFLHFPILLATYCT